jgi:hypothetical protein
MENLIERYVYAVISRLPEKEQREVEKELRANIYDMLPEGADEREVENVLYKLGEPSILAEEYRQSPGYLISPRLYREYIKILKWFLPITGIVLCGVGILLGAIAAINDDIIEISKFIEKMLIRGISLGVDGVIQVLLWTTIGFVIAERTGHSGKKEKWKIADLPEVNKKDKKKIVLSETVVELVILTLAFIVLLVMNSGHLTSRVGYFISYEGMQVTQIFTAEFWQLCIRIGMFVLMVSIGECILKIKVRRWTGLVSGLAIANCLAQLGLTILIFCQKNIFSQEFIPIVQKLKENDAIKYWRLGVMGILVFAVIVTIIECGTIIYRLLRK